MSKYFKKRTISTVFVINATLSHLLPVYYSNSNNNNKNEKSIFQ